MYGGTRLAQADNTSIQRSINPQWKPSCRVFRSLFPETPHNRRTNRTVSILLQSSFWIQTLKTPGRLLASKSTENQVDVDVFPTALTRKTRICYLLKTTNMYVLLTGNFWWFMNNNCPLGSKGSQTKHCKKNSNGQLIVLALQGRALLTISLVTVTKHSPLWLPRLDCIIFIMTMDVWNVPCLDTDKLLKEDMCYNLYLVSQ